MQHDATCDWPSEDFGGLSDVSAPAEPTGAGVFHLVYNDDGGDSDSWTSDIFQPDTLAHLWSLKVLKKTCLCVF